MRVLMIALVLAVVGCNGFDVNIGKGPAANPADAMSASSIPEACGEKDPVTRLCK